MLRPGTTKTTEASKRVRRKPPFTSEKQQQQQQQKQQYPFRKPILLITVLLVVGSMAIYASFLHQVITQSIPKSTTTISNPPRLDIVDQRNVPQLSVNQDNNNNNNNHILALIYPPGLMGGYRNQVIRILALCVYAMQHNMDQLLLPSILWATQINIDGKETWAPIPHSLLFDVEYWNAERNSLPKLVDYEPSRAHLYDCWSTLDSSMVHKTEYNLLTQHVLQQGFLTPILNMSIQVATRQVVVNPRKMDLLPDVQHCQSPVPYGSGKGAGRLWNDYIAMQNQQQQMVPFQADAKLLNALRPKQEWRDLAMSCVTQHVAQTTKTTDVEYLALHARIELEMMDHACGRMMEKNLTVLLRRVEDLVHEKHPSTKGIFIAVSRAGIEVKEGGMYKKFKTYADDNLATMNRVVGDGMGNPGEGLDGGKLAVFECGRQLMDQYYAENPESMDYGQLLQSMVNFYIATESTAFVGVRGSSYSTDIWTTRFHQGKGAQNYEYTLDGIQLMENGGLPPPHKNCARK